ncbi:hypothetical protein RND81_12G142400 [Saponaria officinalis]|uniref:TELO2 ARM repeat domain-containing protein n=1 Tax=Saponaria officinalis TaxID=3572 RepID=A0AAW1HAI1_SAPOF
MEEEKMKKSEVEKQVLEKVTNTISSINSAQSFNDVVLSLHSLASLLFSINSSSLSGVISKQYIEQLKNEEHPSESERRQLWEVFYRGVAFPTLARFLIYDVASNWLSRLPVEAQKLVYDIFFVKGLFTEVVQAVIPCLDHNAKAVRSNAERLVVICLLENEGVLQMARELGILHESEDSSQSAVKLTVSRVAQLVASVPDKSRLKAPKSLSSHYFFKNITTQLLAAAEEISLKAHGSNDVDVSFQFVGEMFTRICRRGSADLLLSELIPHILKRVRSFFSSHTDTNLEGGFMLDSSFKFWFLMMEIIKDAYAVEKMAEQILHQLVAECANDVEAYWVLWILFHRSFKLQTSVRFLFVEKFVLLKVFPLRCLKWILQFSVFGCPPEDGKLKNGENKQLLLETVQRVVVVWSKREFVQSAPLEQQVHVTAAAGLMLETMSKGELDATKDVMRSILEGVSCRLENPDDLVRKMACSIALVFSKVIDPNNPLYLDNSFKEENVDWEFGLATANPTNRNSENKEIAAPSSNSVQKLEVDHEGESIRGRKVNAAKKRSSKCKLVDSLDVIAPSTLNDELLFSDEEDGNSSEDSEGSSDSSLQPYDLTDDDSDLKKKISQLVDIVGALRKTDDPDGGGVSA